MQKHGVILDMSCNKFTFWLSHCQHSRVKKLLVLTVKKLAPNQKLKKPHAEPHVPIQKSNKSIKKGFKLPLAPPLVKNVRTLSKSSICSTKY